MPLNNGGMLMSYNNLNRIKLALVILIGAFALSSCCMICRNSEQKAATPAKN